MIVVLVEFVNIGRSHIFGWWLFVSEHTETVKKLSSLHILNEQSQTGRLPGWRLNEVFRKNLKIALTGGYAEVCLCSLKCCVNSFIDTVVVIVFRLLFLLSSAEKYTLD